jgi:lipopolysaccharide export system permease protein
MFDIFNGKKAAQYIFFEMIPSFLLGLVVFISIILMFQVLRLTEFALVHGVGLNVILEIIGYFSISLMPILFPMSLLFAIILTYGRLSADSEIVAMKASGMHMIMILMPALVLAALISVLSAQTSFNIAPWGNRQSEILSRRVANMRAGIALKEGTFAEGFFDMVIYAGEVNSKEGKLRKVFIYDESSGSTPLTIIAKAGQIIPDPEAPGHNVLLRLTDGDIHRKAQTHTKIKFDTYDIQLSDPIKEDHSEKSPQSMTLEEVEKKLHGAGLDIEDRRILETEYHKRWATSFLCVIFALIGVGLGTNTNRRAQKAGGMILCILIIIVYWILYVAVEGLARSGAMPAGIAIWIPNIIFALFGLETLRRNWN